MNCYLGIDFGTSGARAIAIDANKRKLVEVSQQFVPVNNLASSWQQTLWDLIGQIPLEWRKQVKAIAIDGTSSTVLLCDRMGNPVAEPLMYNDGRGVEAIATLKEIVPPKHTALSATSSLAKLLWFVKALNLKAENYYFLHQADWLAFLLHGKLGISDYHNALKLGYDVENLCYPSWLENLPQRCWLPKVLAPGTPVSEVTAAVAHSLSLPADCLVCTGTTDSIAAFLASGASLPGEAVTSLGSTLAVKLLSQTRVEDASYGIYSHRLGDLWLAGGASNTGGAVLRKFFTDGELADLSRQINPDIPSLLDYYPLLKEGDRFPINDPNLPPRLTPRPTDSVEFLHGLLESMARIETRGYQLLQELGATKLKCVYTAGGGAKNAVWTKIRSRHLQVPMLPPLQADAAYGVALLSQEISYTDKRI